MTKASPFLNKKQASDILKCTIFVTQKCNLACDYCYIDKKNRSISIPIAQKILNFVFSLLKNDEKLDIGLFGGEPLLEFDLVKELIVLIQGREGFDHERVSISVVTNGTLLTEDMLTFFRKKGVVLCVSCDGPPGLQDTHRHFQDGRGSSSLVEQNIRRSLEHFPLLPVNAVYSPETLPHLLEVVEYMISIGIRNIYLNPEISAPWREQDAEILREVYTGIGNVYVEHYKQDTPKYISLIDHKIALILRGGYKANEMCSMGIREFAFAPSGNIYPCERLVGSDEGSLHCIGNIERGFVPGKTCSAISCSAINAECNQCGLRDYCMNWCGCTNYLSTGRYDVVSPFICASERAAIKVAFHVINEMNKNRCDLSHHLLGSSLVNVAADL